jgi:hypothetical protein
MTRSDGHKLALGRVIRAARQDRSAEPCAGFVAGGNAMQGSIRKSAGFFSLVTACAVIACGIADAQAQGSLKKQVVGVWSLVSAENTHSDGKKSLPFGPDPKGMAVLDASGRFMILNTASNLPKFATNSRATGTAEENKAVVTGSIGLFGTYTVDEAGKAMVWRVEASTYPNWVGQEQKRPINSITADEIRWTNPASSTGGATTLLVWKRVK